MPPYGPLASLELMPGFQRLRRRARACARSGELQNVQFLRGVATSTGRRPSRHRYAAPAIPVLGVGFRPLPERTPYRLDELPTRKAHIVETLLLGAVITLLVSRRLLLAVQERLRRTSYKMPEQRWAAIFAAAAPAILDIVLLLRRVSKVIARRLESMLLHEAPDPNRSRQLLIERVECSAAWA